MPLVKAYAAHDSKGFLQPYSIERRNVRDQDVQIDIRYCGICHSDIHQVRGEWGNSTYPMVPGHEIVGIVSQVGSQVTRFKVGDPVGVGCLVNSCRECDDCKSGLEQYCAAPVWTYNSTDHDGSLTYGGYSQQIVVDQNYVLKVPKNLPLDAAAPLLCAGITLYSPLRHWKIGPQSHVGIMGLGGLGHMGVKLAKAMGAQVSVLSHSQKKEADALRLGADQFLESSDLSTFSKHANSFDLLLNTIPVELNWANYINLLKRDGTLVMLGIPDATPSIPPFMLIGKRRALAGSVIGGIAETQEMLDFCGKHQIVSDIEKISIDQVNEAYERTLKSEVRYRFVIDLGSYD
ncbi:MAG: NAD(P)-dependent alcohol dehydrogenase [Deltaproteobacteria bacterium]|nr:NAD(P)-dependent alcohol dehydrogenase [Deltaproteobacteria bacterium]